MILTNAQRENLLRYTSQLNNYFDSWLYSPVQAKLSGVMPSEIIALRDSIGKLLGGLQSNLETRFELDTTTMPVAKLAIQNARRNIAETQEGLRKIVVDSGVHRDIDDLMLPIREFQENDWYNDTADLRVPAVTDFLSLHSAYEVLRSYMGPKPEKEFDGKFGILQSQRTFMPQLKYSRVEASLRNSPTTVAFADIDHFKRFNDDLTETVVDREILWPVMRLIESQCYSRGDAFMFGGDEYMLLLPNMDELVARRFLFGLQETLANLTFPVTDSRISISIGCCTVSADSKLTDQEILDYAAKAKAHAKVKRDCLGVYNLRDYSAENLVNISRRDLTLGEKGY